MVPAGKAEVLCCYMLSSSHLFSLQMVFVTCLCVACVPALPGGHKPLVRVKEDMILLTLVQPFSSCCVVWEALALSWDSALAVSKGLLLLSCDKSPCSGLLWRYSL